MITAEESEFFPTPAWAVYRILEALDLPGGWWLDPCVGEGAIPQACSHRTWSYFDIRPTGFIATHHDSSNVCDYLSLHLCAASRHDVCILNPPFSKALAFAQKALTHCDHVVMLQRLNWLQGPKERTDWLRSHPPGVYVLPDRPSFSGDGKTDGGGYAWYVWPPQHATIQMLATTGKDEIRSARYPSSRRQTTLTL